MKIKTIYTVFNDSQGHDEKVNNFLAKSGIFVIQVDNFSIQSLGSGYLVTTIRYKEVKI